MRFFFLLLLVAQEYRGYTFTYCMYVLEPPRVARYVYTTHQNHALHLQLPLPARCSLPSHHPDASARKAIRKSPYISGRCLNDIAHRYLNDYRS